MSSSSILNTLEEPLIESNQQPVVQDAEVSQIIASEVSDSSVKRGQGDEK